MAAPKTVLTYPLNGTLKDFPIPFEYLARKFVVVTLVGATRRVLILNSEYRFTTKKQITTTSAWGPAQGFDLIEIRRVTSATERLVDFSDGSILRAYDLNTAQVQSLHIAEEARDLTADTIGVNNDGDLDARGRRIVNLADPINPGDAVNLRMNQQWAGSALNQATASAASASASQASRLASEAARDSAIAAKVASEAARDAALGSKNAAGTSADAAASSASVATRQAADSASSASASQASRLASEAARDLTLGYRDAASASATAAAGSAAGVNMPNAAGRALQFLRQNAGVTGLEYVAPGSGGGIDADSVDGYHAGGAGWPRVPVIAAGGGMEVGKALDFHFSATDGIDFAARLAAESNGAFSIFATQQTFWGASVGIANADSDNQYLFRAGRIDSVNSANNAWRNAQYRAAGHLFQNTGGVNILTLDDGGNVNITGSLYAPRNITCSGTLTASGNVASSYWLWSNNSGGRMAMSTGHALEFHWNNGFYYRIDGNGWVLINNAPSDRSLKDIEGDTNAEDAGRLIDQLAQKSVKYSFKKSAPISLPEGSRYGFIAQDTVPILPSLFKETGVAGADDGCSILTFNDDAPYQLISLLVKTVSELRGRVSALEQK